MRRGQDAASRLDPNQGYTKQDLMAAAGVSAKSFDLIRKAARVRGPGHGGLGWVFSRRDVETMIERAQTGRFTELGPVVVRAWRDLLDGKLDEDESDDE